jgi:SAM-dependent methyltransferase
MENIFEHNGHCPICQKPSKFTSKESWFRDHLLCEYCNSIPRKRALMKVIEDYYPNWRELCIHESSPGGRGASLKLHGESNGYSASQYYPDITPGNVHPKSGYRSENLEKMTFSDESFDLFISQDVMEHIFDPAAAFIEIARVLKQGGAHIFTVPLVNKASKSEVWASRTQNNEIVYLHEPEYHGNPVDEKGSLVTMHWGYDIANFILETTGMPTSIITIDNIDLGIRAEFIEILISFKKNR